MGDKTVKSKKKDGVSRRQVLKGAGVATGAAAVSSIFTRPATAAKFPNKPVKLVVPFGTAGGSNRTMRLMAPYIEKYLGVPVQVINIKGAGGWVAWDQQSKWDPVKDDHMLGTVNFPHVMSLLDPRMKRKQTLKSFNFIAWQSLDPCLWAVKEGDPRFSTLKEFLAVAAKKPNGLVMSTTAVGSDDHMGIAYAEKFLPNFKVRKVYANSDGKKIGEVVGGHTDAVGGNIGYYVPYFTDAKLRAICVLGHERSPNLPNTPTFKEVTGLANVVYAGRVFSVAPGLPKEKSDVYVAAIKKAMHDPEYQIKELNNKNPLVYRDGKELHDAIAENEKFVNSVKYWEDAK